jgi:hypothetical protein
MYNGLMNTSNITLTNEQASRIVQALIFSASGEICADWDDTDHKEMLALARSVMSDCYSNNEKLDLEKIYLFGEPPYEQVGTQYIPGDFGLKVKTT